MGAGAPDGAEAVVCFAGLELGGGEGEESDGEDGEGEKMHCGRCLEDGNRAE